MITKLSSFFDCQEYSDESSSSRYLVASWNGQSYKVNVLSIAASIAEELRVSLGTMAYAQSGEYAMLSHDHDIYTSAIWVQNNSSQALCVLATVHDMTNSTSTQMSAISIDDPSYAEYAKARISSLQPKLGELKFLSMLSHIASYNDPKFNGWVPADGRQYELQDFVLSSSLTSIFQHTASTFVVPTLSSFIRLACDLSACTAEVSPHFALRSHTHKSQSSANMPTLDMKTTKVKLTSSMSVTPRQDGNPCGSSVHVGAGSGRTNATISAINTCDITLSDIKTSNASAGTADDTYPSSVSLPPYVYVGRSRFSEQPYSS